MKKYQQQGITALEKGKRIGVPARLPIEQLNQPVIELADEQLQLLKCAVWKRSSHFMNKEA